MKHTIFSLSLLLAGNCVAQKPKNIQKTVSFEQPATSDADVRPTLIRVYAKDENNKATSATGSVNGKVVATANSEGILVFKDLREKDRIRIYKTGYDTIYVLVDEFNLGNTLYGQLYPVSYNFKQAVPWEKIEEKPGSVPGEEPVIMDYVDESASFPGGRAAMNKYIIENFRYPQSAMEQGIEGKVYIGMVVLEDGTLTEIKVARKLPGCPECDQEAVRLVENMPKWIPGKKGDVAKKTYFTLPVIFKMQ